MELYTRSEPGSIERFGLPERAFAKSILLPPIQETLSFLLADVGDRNLATRVDRNILERAVA